MAGQGTKPASPQAASAVTRTVKPSSEPVLPIHETSRWLICPHPSGRIPARHAPDLTGHRLVGRAALEQSRVGSTARARLALIINTPQ